MAAGFFVARQKAGEADGTSGKRRRGRDRTAGTGSDGRSGSGRQKRKRMVGTKTDTETGPNSRSRNRNKQQKQEQTARTATNAQAEPERDGRNERQERERPPDIGGENTPSAAAGVRFRKNGIKIPCQLSPAGLIRIFTCKGLPALSAELHLALVPEEVHL